MSAQNGNNHIIRYESLSDFNFISSSSLRGGEWTSIIQEEIQASTNQPIESEETNTNKLVVSVTLGILGLLSVAMWTQVPKISQALQEAGRNSIQELIRS